LGVPSVEVTYQCTSVSGPSGMQTLAFYNLTSCTITPSSVTLTSTPTPVQVSVQTSGTVSASLQPGLRRSGLGALYAAFLTLPGVGLVGIGWSTKRRKKVGRYAGVALLSVLLGILLACGGGGGGQGVSPPPNPTPAGNYTVNVTGTSSGTTTTTSSTITVGFTVSIGG